MNSNNNNLEKIFESKTEYRHSESRDNFAINNELTVLITLDEYRTLIKEVATKKHDIDKVGHANYELRRENENLKEENEKLKNILYDLQVKQNDKLFEEINNKKEQTQEDSND